MDQKLNLGVHCHLFEPHLSFFCLFQQFGLFFQIILKKMKWQTPDFKVFKFRDYFFVVYCVECFLKI